MSRKEPIRLSSTQPEAQNDPKEAKTPALPDRDSTAVRLAGLLPALAVCTSLKSGLGMGLSAAAVLICTNLSVSLLDRYIPPRLRGVVPIALAAVFTTAAELLMRVLAPSVYGGLGIYLSLLCVNCLVLSHAQAPKSPPSAALLGGVTSGLRFALALAAVSAVRELLGSGTLFGFPLLGAGYRPALLMLLPPGGFLTLGLASAAVRRYKTEKAGREARAK